MDEHMKNLVCLKINHALDMLVDIDMHPSSDGRKLDTAIILLNEIKKILSDNFKILSLSDLNFNDEIIESGKTLAQNADIKASYINKLYNIDCFADDTGLEVESLNGAPGVYSSRFAGNKKRDEDNIILSLVDKSIIASHQ